MKVETLKKIGGSEWKKGGEHRVYFNNLEDLYGVNIVRNGKGNIEEGYLADGTRLWQREAKALSFRVNNGKVYYNVLTGKFGYSVDKDVFDKVKAEIARRANELETPKPATKAEIMKRAWQIAREGAKAFGGSSKKYFAEALREAWAETRMARAA